MKSSAWPALGWKNDAVIDSTLAAELFKSPLATTVRQLETFKSCPYQHFVKWGLGLRTRPERRIHSSDLSAVYRDVLARLVGDLVKAKSGWETIDDSQMANIIEQHTRQLVTGVAL